MPALAKASDLIVVGTIESVVESRQVAAVPEWGEDGNIAYALATVRVANAIKGFVSSGELVDLELFVPVPSMLRSVSGTVPRERTLFVLSRKPDVPYYGLVNPEAYFRDLGGAVPPVARSRRGPLHYVVIRSTRSSRRWSQDSSDPSIWSGEGIFDVGFAAKIFRH